MSRGRALGGLAAALLVLFGAAQLIRRPSLDNPPLVPAMLMRTHVQVPGDVDSILRRACYDCHSYETRWPLYARVAPVSWLVARDVTGARSDLNFSQWGTDPEREPTPGQRLGPGHTRPGRADLPMDHRCPAATPALERASQRGKS